MIGIETKGVKELQRALGDQAKRLPRELATAVNATAKATRRQMAKEVTKELAAPVKTVASTLSQPKKASASTLSAAVRLSKTKRISLKEFGARQTKAGVSAKISKSRGRTTIPGGFQGPKPGVMKVSWRGNAFKRVGKSRLPIVKLQGPSPWGVYVKRGATKASKDFAAAELEKQIQRRVRAVMVRRGLITT